MFVSVVKCQSVTADRRMVAATVPPSALGTPGAVQCIGGTAVMVGALRAREDAGEDYGRFSWGVQVQVNILECSAQYEF